MLIGSHLHSPLQQPIKPDRLLESNLFKWKKNSRFLAEFAGLFSHHAEEEYRTRLKQHLQESPSNQLITYASKSFLEDNEIHEYNALWFVFHYCSLDSPRLSLLDQIKAMFLNRFLDSTGLSEFFSGEKPSLLRDALERYLNIGSVNLGLSFATVQGPVNVALQGICDGSAPEESKAVLLWFFKNLEQCMDLGNIVLLVDSLLGKMREGRLLEGEIVDILRGNSDLFTYSEDNLRPAITRILRLYCEEQKDGLLEAALMLLEAYNKSKQSKFKDKTLKENLEEISKEGPEIGHEQLLSEVIEMIWK